MEEQKTDETTTALEQCFLAFARGVLAQMKRWMLAEGVYGNVYFAHTFHEHGYNRETELALDYARFLQLHINDLLSMEDTQHCVQRHIQAHVLLPSLREFKRTEALESAPRDGASTEHLEQQVVLDLLVPLIESCKLHAVLTSREQLLLPNDEQLLRQYRRLLALWDDPLDHVEITFPTVNFFCDAKEPQPLGTHLVLTPLSSADKTALYNNDAMNFTFSSPPLGAQALMGISWKIFGTYAFQRHERQEQSNKRQEVLYEMNDVLTALRLLKKGDVGTPALYEKMQTPVFWQGTRLTNLIRDQQVRQFPLSRFENYELREQDIPAVKELSQALHQLRTRQRPPSFYGDMEVALRRFNQSYNRDLLEDQIIDLTIALEGSLLGDLRDELKYRLAVRGAALLASAGTWEPRKSQALLRVMYDVRSKIVHSGQLLIQLEKDIKKLQFMEVEPHTFVQWCEDIVRDVLKAYILRMMKGQSLNHINEELDRQIIDGLIVRAPAATEGADT